MRQNGFKIAAGILAVIVTVSSTGFISGATGLTLKLPVAGLALVLEEGTSIEEVKEVQLAKEVAQQNETNVVYNIEIDLTQPITLDAILEQTSVVEAPLVIVSPVNTQLIESNAIAQNTSNTEQNNSVAKSIAIEDTDIPTTATPIIPEVTPATPAVVNGVLSAESGTIDTSLNVETSGESTTVVDEAKAVEDTSETAAEVEDFSDLVIAQVNDYVNVRSLPSEDGEIVGKLYDKSVGKLISSTDGWYEIQSGNVVGYVKAEYVVTGEETIALAKEVGTRVATVTTTTLFVREEPNTDAAILGMVPIEDELSVVAELDGWVQVSIEEGDGYVSAEYVSLRTDFVQAESKEEEAARKAKEEAARKAAQAAAREATAQVSSSSTSATVTIPVASGGSESGNAVANYGCQFVGNPYVYGGTSLTNGTDCSGFVQSVYANFGISLPRTSGSQRSAGYDVGGIENAQPGDIICYSGHVAIYIGNGQIVHASTTRTGIIISNATYKKILAVRRIF